MSLYTYAYVCVPVREYVYVRLLVEVLSVFIQLMPSNAFKCPIKRPLINFVRSYGIYIGGSIEEEL